MEIVIVQGDLAHFSADIIVNAASTSLEMGGGVAAALRKAGGKEIEDEALEAAPLELGQAIATSAGKLDAKFVIHAASMKLGGGSSEEHVRLSFRNSLELADSLECESIAVPAIGAGAGGFPVGQCAQVLLSEAKGFGPGFLKTVFFVLSSPEGLSVFAQKAKELGVPLTNFSDFKKRVKAEEEKRESARLDKESEEDSLEEKNPVDSIEPEEEKESASEDA